MKMKLSQLKRLIREEVKKAVETTNDLTHPCPTCGAKNAVSKRDYEEGYHCDACTEKSEKNVRSFGW